MDIHTDEQQPLLWKKMSLFYGYQGAFYTPPELKKAFFDTVGSLEKEMKGEMLSAAGHEAFPEIKIELVFEGLFKRKNVSCGEELTILTGQFFRALSTEYIRLYDGARELLSRLKKSGARLFLLTNAQRAFTEYELRALDITGYFDGIIISSDCGVKKPDIRFFTALLERYSLAPADCLMLGNDRSTDIAGAKAAGMAALYIHSNLSPEPDNGPRADFEESDIKSVLRQGNSIY